VKDDRLYLIHISECILRVEKYMGNGGRDGFMQSDIIQDAVIRNLQIMAESATRVSNALQEKHPEVDWFKIRGFRNVLVHDYLGVDLQSVWNILEKDLPKLKSAVENILNP
jgi:uncharacterized protein with HEPN domain